jgi:electron transfer flavoprotein beta subunit
VIYLSNGKEGSAVNIIVCVKQVLDPELPPSAFKIDPEAKKAIAPRDRAPVISPFDENAVEAALRIKDAHGATITTLCLGRDLDMAVVKKPLSMGADELILLQDDAFEGSDSFATAYALATAIKKIGEFDLIFCGRQAADWDAGQVGLGIAELLGIPSVTPAQKIEIKDGKVAVERVVADGYEVVEVSPPVLITVSNELGEPRYPTMKGIMVAKKKAVTVWTAQDLGLDKSMIGASAAKSKMLKLFIPVREAKCEFVAGETAEEFGANLALKLREAKLL